MSVPVFAWLRAAPRVGDDVPVLLNRRGPFAERVRIGGVSIHLRFTWKDEAGIRACRVKRRLAPRSPVAPNRVGVGESRSRTSYALQGSAQECADSGTAGRDAG